MPATKKPAGRQVGNRPESTKIVKLPPPASLAPTPPADLLPATLEEWETYWTSDVGGSAVETDRPTLERLFIYRDMWRKARAIYESRPMTKGSTGQVKMHPAADQMLKLETAMSSLEAKLGMTPYDRQRLGIAIGQAVLTASEVNRLANPDSDETEAEEASVIEIEAEWTS